MPIAIVSKTKKYILKFFLLICVYSKVKIKVCFTDYEVEGAAASKSGGTKQEKKNSQKKEVKRLPTASASDDIDKMKVSR